eukprot:CAMPEP_0172525058 /NCGR_PEP_ID=MMETSP1067-20121228/60_1 /TAXON_ID=265564 ORGANISM="Thalassiosira punctigera, Strain Tpunct2005C2" /NCGR_SAMPLE_ID=MMETSP1067 /ASSEMBLY_ACC=CAM_ASM_000444 /LENGTH=32 /DNA_ID= /DNA_START= /DNA_END= /DNA_ORIENTATION=
MFSKALLALLAVPASGFAPIAPVRSVARQSAG